MMPTHNNNDIHNEEVLGHHTALKISILGALALFSVLVVSFDKLQVSAPVVSTHVQKENPFERISLEATSAYVYDLSTGEVLFAKNEEQQVPLASLTKLMTAVVASGVVPENAVVTIPKEAIAIEGDSGLTEGERWRFKDLLDFTLLVSSNDGAGALASAANAFSNRSSVSSQDFITKMNAEAGTIGLPQSYYLNESGLDANTKVSGGYGSARDTAHLVAYILSKKPKLLEATAYPTLSIDSESGVYTARNTNPIVDSIPGLIASKTGFTDLAGGNLVIAFDAGINHPIVAVALGSSFDGRFSDIQKLVRASIEAIAE